MPKHKPSPEKKVYRVFLPDIRTAPNAQNLPAKLAKKGHTWESLWALGNGEPDQRAEFVALIEKEYTDIQALGASILASGLLQAVGVRYNGPKSGTYSVTWGSRRCLATLYNWCTTQKPKKPFIDATMDGGSGTQTIHKGIIENSHRRMPNPIEEAKHFHRAVNAGQSEQELADDLGVSLSTVRNRLSLLKLEPKAQKAVAEGRVGATVAAKAARKGLDPLAESTEPADPQFKMMGRKDVQAWLEETADESETYVLRCVLGMESRKVIAGDDDQSEEEAAE